MLPEKLAHFYSAAARAKKVLLICTIYLLKTKLFTQKYLEII